MLTQAVHFHHMLNQKWEGQDQDYKEDYKEEQVFRGYEIRILDF